MSNKKIIAILVEDSNYQSLINFNNLLDRDPIIVNNEESIKFLSNKNIIIKLETFNPF